MLKCMKGSCKLWCVKVLKMCQLGNCKPFVWLSLGKSYDISQVIQGGTPTLKHIWEFEVCVMYCRALPIGMYFGCSGEMAQIPGELLQIFASSEYCLNW